MPPAIVRCSYLPVNFVAYALGSRCGAPLASPSSVIVGTAMTGDCARRFSRSSSPKWDFDDATFDRSAAAFDNPDHVAIVIHNYRCASASRKARQDRGELPNELRKIVPVFVVA